MLFCFADLAERNDYRLTIAEQKPGFAAVFFSTEHRFDPVGAKAGGTLAEAVIDTINQHSRPAITKSAFEKGIPARRIA